MLIAVFWGSREEASLKRLQSSSLGLLAGAGARPREVRIPRLWEDNKGF